MANEIASVWAFSRGRVMRVDDGPDGRRTWGPVPIARALPGLAVLGVGPQDFATNAGRARAVSDHEVVMVVGTFRIEGETRLDLARGGAVVARPYKAQLGDLPPQDLDTTAVEAEVPELAERGMTPIATAWTTVGDPDDWPHAPVTSDVPTATLRAVIAAAQAVGDLDPLALTLICDMESGLRHDAYHPLGRYGLLQLDVSALNLAGWRDEPGALLTAPPAAQAPVIGAHLAGLDLGRADDFGTLWAQVLTMGDPLPALTPETVVAAARGPRPELWATHQAADVTADGVLTINDLGLFQLQRLDLRRGEELRLRLRDLS